MSKELPFAVYCIEEYKSRKNMTGKAVIELFRKYNVLDYVYTYYESLHTTGAAYTVEDIDQYIQTQTS